MLKCTIHQKDSNVALTRKSQMTNKNVVGTQSFQKVDLVVGHEIISSRVLGFRTILVLKVCVYLIMCGPIDCFMQSAEALKILPILNHFSI